MLHGHVLEDDLTELRNLIVPLSVEDAQLPKTRADATSNGRWLRVRDAGLGSLPSLWQGNAGATLDDAFPMKRVQSFPHCSHERPPVLDLD